MKEAELRVTLAICRYTFGWHKKEDEISLSRLQEMTGLSRQGVIQGIEAGMQRGVIRRRPRGQSFMYRLRLVNVVDQLTEDTRTGPQKPPQLVNVVDQSVQPASQLSRPVGGVASQLSRPELVNYVDSQKKGKKDHDPTPPTPTRAESKNGGGGGGEDSQTYQFLIDEGIGAAAEFADIPYDVMRADYDARRKDNQTKAAIVRAWRTKRPTLRARAVAQPLTATRANLPETTVAPAEMLRQLRERR
jgi:phage replication O-like protein O